MRFDYIQNVIPSNPLEEALFNTLLSSRSTFDLANHATMNTPNCSNYPKQQHFDLIPAHFRTFQ